MKFAWLSVAAAFASRVFPTAGGTVEEDAARGFDPDVAVGLGILERELDRLFQDFAHFVQTSDLLPSDGRDLDRHVPEARRLDLLQRLPEVLLGDLHPFQQGDRDGLVEINLGKVPAQRPHRRFTTERGEVRAHESVALGGEFLQQALAILLRALDRHPSRVDLQDLEPTLLGRDSDLDFPVEPTGAAERRVDRLLAVGRRDHDDVPPTGETVHQGEQLGDDPTFDLADDLVAAGGDRIELVDEDHARRVLLGLLELLPKLLLALSVVLRDDLRALDADEVGASLVGHRLGDEGLARSRRAVEQHPFRRGDREPVEQLRMLQRQFDHLADPTELLLEAPDILVGDTGRRNLGLADRLFLDRDQRRGGDLDEPLRLGRDHHER